MGLDVDVARDLGARAADGKGPEARQSLGGP